jgi:hypothetical protein
MGEKRREAMTGLPVVEYPYGTTFSMGESKGLM